MTAPSAKARWGLAWERRVHEQVVIESRAKPPRGKDGNIFLATLRLGEKLFLAGRTSRACRRFRMGLVFLIPGIDAKVATAVDIQEAVVDVTNKRIWLFFRRCLLVVKTHSKI